MTGSVLVERVRSMQSGDQTMDLLISLTKTTKSHFHAVSQFAKIHGTSISGLYYYVAIGALNFNSGLPFVLKQEGMHNVLYAAIKPMQAAKILNCDSKQIARWCITLTKQNLLKREVGGAYRVADVSLWYEASKLINSGKTETGSLLDPVTTSSIE